MIGYNSIESHQTPIGIIQARIITPDMINDEFIQQFDGLIVPGATDNFPKDKKEFTLKDLNPENMIPTEKLYQHVDGLADKYNIPTIGMCSGNQHIILYHQGTLMPVDNYVDPSDKNNHQGIFKKNSVPYFLTLTPNEQRRALQDCSLPEVVLDIVTAHHYAGVKEKLGGALKVGALSEEGVVQSVYNGVRFFGFQFHPENFYFSSSLNPNRNRLIWENFLEICRQRHRYHLYAKEHNLDFQAVMNIKNKQNENIVTRLEECAKKELPSEVNPNSTDCKWLYQITKRYNLNFQETMKGLLDKQKNNEEKAKIQQCIQQETFLDTSSRLDYDESLPKNKDSCDQKKFQWSDYVLLNDKIVNSYTNSTCGMR
jgi:gamma-glutamyl-gamma-aminobutyrate hydrolase PuuD